MFRKFIFIQRARPFGRLLVVALLVLTSVLFGEVIRPFGLFPLGVVQVPVPVFIQQHQGDCFPPPAVQPRMFHASEVKEA